MTAKDVKDMREALGLSQREFARRLHLSHMTINRAEEFGPKRSLIAYIDAAIRNGTIKLHDHKIKPERTR
jgi:transcriptional regulator with XRE-family HTH domain